MCERPPKILSVTCSAPLASRYQEGDHWGEGVRRRRALIGTSQEPAPDIVRFSALHPCVRHVQSCLSFDERRARIHAAAGPAADRGLYAATVASPLYPRQSPPTERSPFRSARCRSLHLPP